MNAAINVLEDFLIEYGTEIGFIDVSELDGFLAAVACAPSLIQPSALMTDIWDIDFRTPIESQVFTSAVAQHYATIIENLDARTYSPLFLEYRNESSVIVVTGWCDGFIRGLEFWETLPPEKRTLLDHYCFAMRLFSEAAMTDIQIGMSVEEKASMRVRITKDVENIYRSFRGTENSRYGYTIS